MAILYTDNLTGNDTTGLGTIAQPYKTIVKAIQVGTDGDEIRVAGSGFTALPGTASNIGASTFSTSQSLVGLVSPGDIITYNDTDYGDQKFFFKVFAVTSTSLTLAAGPNIREGFNVTLSKLTQNHYYSTVTNTTFENISTVTSTSKSQFDIRGGWINNFTEQTGWTAMVFQGGTSTAVSGTAFTASQGNNTYIDRFMLAHLSNGLTGASVQTQIFFPGTIAALHMLASATLYTAQAKNHTNPAYVTKNAYLTNSCFAQIQNPPINADLTPALSYTDVWSQRNANNLNTGSAIKITNLYTKGSGGNNPQASNLNLIPSAHVVLDNLFISSTANTVQYNNITSVSAMLYLNGTITKLGSNKSTIYLGNYGMAQYYMPTQNIESLDAVDHGGFQSVIGGNPTTNFLTNIRTTGYVKDIEGEKSILGAGQIIFADPTEYSTGLNSLRLSKSLVFVGGNSFCPVDAVYIDTATAKTITIRCKSSVAGNVVFSLGSNQKCGVYNLSNNATNNPTVTVNVNTGWTDVTYPITQSQATTYLNSYVPLLVQTASLPGKYIWIDSVTVA